MSNHLVISVRCIAGASASEAFSAAIHLAARLNTGIEVTHQGIAIVVFGHSDVTRILAEWEEARTIRKAARDATPHLSRAEVLRNIQQIAADHAAHQVSVDLNLARLLEVLTMAFSDDEGE